MALDWQITDTGNTVTVQRDKDGSITTFVLDKQWTKVSLYSVDIALLEYSNSNKILYYELLIDWNDTSVPVVASGAALVAAIQAILDDTGGSGVTSLSAIGATPNANAATITGTVLNLEPASATFGGVVTTIAQSFAGAKTFNDDVTIGSDFILSQNSSGISGNDADLNVHPSTNIRLTNGGLVSLASISTTGIVTGHQIWLHNDTGGDVIVVDNFGAPPVGSDPIITTLGGDILLTDTASVILEYDSTDQAWRLVGNVGFASATYSGYLSTTDWNTFNSKQSALTFPLAANLGGTGIANNAASTITISGNFATTLTVSAVTSVTLPTSGTLYGTQAGSITSAQMLSSMSDETGTGLLVFNNSPTFVDDITVGTAGTGTGQILLRGTTSGTVTLSVADVAGTNTFKLPATAAPFNSSPVLFATTGEMSFPTGTPTGTKFLRDDGSWNNPTATLGDGDYGDVTISGGGTVMTVDSLTTSNEAVDTTNFVVFVNSAASANQVARTNTNFTFDASINRLGATTFIGTAFLSSAASPATTGVFRLSNTGAIRWRNAANLNNYGITLTASDVIEFEAGIAGVNIASGNLTMLTSASITTGTIELGDATDTTLARSGAGVVTIEGAEILTGNPLTVAKGGTGQTTEAEAIGELIQALTQDMLPDPTADFFATYDASADTGKKIQMNQYAPKGHIFGLIMSNAADTANDITIAAGEAVSEDGKVNMVLSASITKQLDAAWAVGTNAGGLNTGVEANSTWYEVHLIRRSDTGVVDVMFTTTANRATLPASYDSQRRIGWIRNDSGGSILQFTQINDYFTLTTPVNDVDATATAAATSRTLTVPPSCIARFRAATLGNTSVNAANGIVFSELVETDTAPTTGNGFNSIGAGDFAIIGAGHIELRVNSSSQIRDRAIIATGSMAYDISTFGWIDGRLRLSSTN